MNAWRKRNDPTRTLHPVWRGVGCFLLILIPIAAWWLSGYAMEYAQAWLPDFARVVRRAGEQAILIQIGVTLVIGLALYLLLSFLSSVLYLMVDETDRLFGRPSLKDKE